MKNMKVNMPDVNIRTLEAPPPKKRYKEIAMLKEKEKLDILPPFGKSSSPHDQGNKLQSSKQSVVMNKGKEKMIEPPSKPTNMWETMPVGYSSKGIVIGLPRRSPLSVHENATISTKPRDKTPTEVRTESMTPSTRNRQKDVDAPSCGNMIYPQDVVDAGLHLNPAITKRSVWFSLTPSGDSNRKDALQLLVEPYVEIIMDGNCNPDVSILMKYIVLHFKHVCQDEVGIFMNGKLLSPEMKLRDVVKQWTTLVDSERKIAKIGDSAENFCVKLTYGRKE